VAHQRWLCTTHQVRLEVDGNTRRITVPPAATPERRNQRIPPRCYLYHAEHPSAGQHDRCEIIQEG